MYKCKVVYLEFCIGVFNRTLSIYTWIQRKIENWQINGQLTFLWYDILVKKGSLQRNGMAAISKRARLSFGLIRMQYSALLCIKLRNKIQI